MISFTRSAAVKGRFPEKLRIAPCPLLCQRAEPPNCSFVQHFNVDHHFAQTFIQPPLDITSHELFRLQKPNKANKQFLLLLCRARVTT